MAFAAGTPAAQPRLKAEANGAWPPTPHDYVNGVAMAGDLVCVSVQFGLRMLDVHDPDHPVQVGSYDETEFYVNGVRVQGHYAYLAYEGFFGGYGVEVIDISDPTKPARKGGSLIDADESMNDFQVTGNCAYFLDTFETIQIVDVSNPKHPHGVVRYPYTGVGGCCFTSLALAGNRAFVLGAPYLYSFDLSDPTNVVPVSLYGTVDQGRLQVRGGYGYVLGGNGQGFQILDVSDPTKLALVGTCCSNATFVQLAVSGNYAYLAAGSLQILDIRDPAHPIPVGGYDFGDIGDRMAGVQVAGNFLYVADGALEVIDVSDPAHPVRRGVFDIRGSGDDLRVKGNYVYLADREGGLQIIDVRNSKNPIQTGHALGSTPGWAYALDVAGNYAYVGKSQNLEVMDITVATNPVSVGNLVVPGFFSDLTVANNYAYLASDSGSGVLVVDVSNPAHPVMMAQTPDFARRLHVVGDYLYVAGSGLTILNVSNPANPVWVSHFGKSGYDVAVNGRYAYLVADPESDDPFQVLDVNDPAHPALLGSAGNPGYPQSVFVERNFAYSTFNDDNGPAGWCRYDVSDPAHPRLIYTDRSRAGQTIKAVGGRIYIAQGRRGLGVVALIPGVQFTFQVQGISGKPVLLESATTLTNPLSWTALYQTNSAPLPFYFTDFELQGQPQKFYRAR